MFKRISIITGLIACLALASLTPAYASDRNAAIAGVVIGAVVGGAIVANSRYEREPVYVESRPRVYYEPERVYYEPERVYYERQPAYRPYTVVISPRYDRGYRDHHNHRDRRHHRGNRHHNRDNRRHDRW